MDAADLAHWSPVRLIVAPPEPVVDWCDFSAIRFTEPFFAATVERILEASPDEPIIRTPLSALASVEAATPGRDPDGFIFHVSRCGSTLVSRLAAMLPDVAVISEPDPLNALLELDPSTIRDDVLVDCVRLLVRAFCRSRKEPHVLFKLSSWNLRLAEVMTRAFPLTRHALVYRDPAEIIASLLAGQPGWMKLRHTQPEQTAWLLGIALAERQTDNDFAMAALAGFFEAALALDERAPLLLVDYRELPTAIWDRVLPYFGCRTGADDIAMLGEAAHWHAKTPGRRFTADARGKRRMIADGLAQEVASRLDPLYIELEARRMARRGSNRGAKAGNSLFYLVSKLFWVVVQPGNLALLVLTLGLGLTATRWHYVGQTVIALVVLLGFLLVFLPVSDWLTAPLEDRFPRPDGAPQCIDGIVVLGGGELRRVTRARNGPEMSDRLMRLVDAAALLRQHPESKLYFTGGGVDTHILPPTEADIARAILRLMDADMARIVFEDRSRDTWENLFNLKQMVAPHKGQTWVLVTSAAHIPRAMGIARRLDWDMIPWPTDYVSIPDARGVDQLNLAGRLSSSQDAIREWIGLVAYRLSGKTDALFPAPRPPNAETTCSKAATPGQ